MSKSLDLQTANPSLPDTDHPLLLIQPLPSAQVSTLPARFIIDKSRNPKRDDHLPVYRYLHVPNTHQYRPKYAKSLRECITTWTPTTLRSTATSTGEALGGPNEYSTGVSLYPLSPRRSTHTTNVLENKECGKWLKSNFPDGIKIHLDFNMKADLQDELDSILNPNAWKTMDDTDLDADVLDFLAEYNTQRTTHVPAASMEEIFYEPVQMGVLRTTTLALVNMVLRFRKVFKPGIELQSVAWGAVKQEKGWGLADACTYSTQTSVPKRPNSQEPSEPTQKQKRVKTEDVSDQSNQTVHAEHAESLTTFSSALAMLVGAILEYKPFLALTSQNMTDAIAFCSRLRDRTLIIRIVEHKTRNETLDYQLFHNVEGRQVRFEDKEKEHSKIIHAFLQMFVEHHKYTKVDGVLFNWYSSICTKLVAKDRLDVSEVLAEDSALYQTITTFGLLVLLAARQRPSHPPPTLFCAIKLKPADTDIPTEIAVPIENKPAINTLKLDIQSLIFGPSVISINRPYGLEWTDNYATGDVFKVWTNGLIGKGRTWTVYKGGMFPPDSLDILSPHSPGPPVRLDDSHSLTSSLNNTPSKSSLKTDNCWGRARGFALAVKVCDRNPTREEIEEGRWELNDAVSAASKEAEIFKYLWAEGQGAGIIPQFHGLWRTVDEAGSEVCVMLLERFRRPLGVDHSDGLKLSIDEYDGALDLIKRFHDRTGMTHGDLQLRHIFCNDRQDRNSYRLIDLETARVASEEERQEELRKFVEKYK